MTRKLGTAGIALAAWYGVLAFVRWEWLVRFDHMDMNDRAMAIMFLAAFAMFASVSRHA